MQIIQQFGSYNSRFITSSKFKMPTATRTQKAKEAEKLQTQLQEYLSDYYTPGKDGETSTVNPDPISVGNWAQGVKDNITFLFGLNREAEDKFDNIESNLEKVNEQLGETREQLETLNEDYRELRSRVADISNPRRMANRPALSSTTVPSDGGISEQLAAAAEAAGIQLHEAESDEDTRWDELVTNLEKHLTDRLTKKFEKKFHDQSVVNANLLKALEIHQERLKNYEAEMKVINSTLSQLSSGKSGNYDNSLARLQDNENQSVVGEDEENVLIQSSRSTRPKIKPKLPTFKGDFRDKPLRFLSDLRSYVHISQLDDLEALYQIKQSLEGPARAWYDVAEQSIKTFKQFESRFRERFWSEAIQDDWARKVESMTFDPNGKFSRLEHATHIWGFALELGTRYTEEELVRKISAHFEWDVRYAVRSQDIKTQAKFFELLTYRDADFVKRNKNKYQSSNKKEERGDQRPPQQTDKANPNIKPFSAQNTNQPMYNKNNNHSYNNNNNNKGAYPKSTQHNQQKSINSVEKHTNQKKEKKNNDRSNDEQSNCDLRALDRKLDEMIQEFDDQGAGNL